MSSSVWQRVPETSSGRAYYPSRDVGEARWSSAPDATSNAAAIPPPSTAVSPAVPRSSRSPLVDGIFDIGVYNMETGNNSSETHGAGNQLRFPQATSPRSLSELPLGSAFKVRGKPSKFFKEGKVFLILWSEPASQNSIASERIIKTIHGEQVYSSIRRFVVIRTSKGFSTCLPILTYFGRGLGKSGAIKSDHAIIYTGKTHPKPLPDEMPARGEPGLQPVCFRVTPFTPGEKLDPLSRINLGKIYTIEHHCKVKGFGTVDDVPALLALHKRIWDGDTVSSFPRSLTNAKLGSENHKTSEPPRISMRSSSSQPRNTLLVKQTQGHGPYRQSKVNQESDDEDCTNDDDDDEEEEEEEEELDAECVF